MSYRISFFCDRDGCSRREFVVRPEPSFPCPVAVAVVADDALYCHEQTSIGGNYGAIQSLAAVNRTGSGAFAPPVRPKPVPIAPRSAESRSDREEVAWVKAHSGLTWDQLGKVFGVSRRAVHMWANGGRLNESNARRLRAFAAIIRGFESEMPDESTAPEVVRARLLQVEPDGLSVIDRLRQEHSAGPTWGAPFGPERLIDAIREPLRTPVGEVEL